MRVPHMTINKNELPGNSDQNQFEFVSELMNKDCESRKYFNALKSFKTFKDAKNSKDYKDFRDLKKSGHSTDSRYLKMGKMFKFLKI